MSEIKTINFTKQQVLDLVNDEDNSEGRIRFLCIDINHPGVTQSILRIGNFCNSHDDIFSNFVSELCSLQINDESFISIGGGFLEESDGIIIATGESDKFKKEIDDAFE